MDLGVYCTHKGTKVEHLYIRLKRIQFYFLGVSIAKILTLSVPGPWALEDFSTFLLHMNSLRVVGTFGAITDFYAIYAESDIYFC